MYKIKTLKGISFEELTETWNLAFSDYIVPENITSEKLEEYFKVVGVAKNKSFGAFHNDKLVGMLFNSIDVYRGEMVAFDAFTGIVPEHRGKGIFTQLFDHTKSKLKNIGIKRYYLEVITTNERAYSIYKKNGGRVDRELSFITGKMNSNYYKDAADVKTLPLSAFPKKELSIYLPTFSNRMIALHRNISEYRVAYIETGSSKTAAIFNNRGSVPQIMYAGTKDQDLLCSVFTYLSRNFEDLRISNIPVSEHELIDELLNMGFKILVNQYEMCIVL